jgi:hypothetical protein
MARFTEKFWNGRWWGRDEWDDMVAAQRALRPKVPYIIRDSLPDVMNPVNGKIYDSRSQYLRAVKDAGCVVVGDDLHSSRAKPTDLESPPGLEQDIKTAIEQLNHA